MDAFVFPRLCAIPRMARFILQSRHVSCTLSCPIIDTLSRLPLCLSTKRFHEDDLIGRVYEYFLQIYAASGTKEDGEFYTPACIVKLIAEMIEPFDAERFEDRNIRSNAHRRQVRFPFAIF